MTDVAGLVLPLFGLIILGYATARLIPNPEGSLGWLSIFIIYLALPALFFKLLSKTPVEQLASFRFILINLAATFIIFLTTFLAAKLMRRAAVPEATIQGLAGSYGNIGYMGPGLAILTFGENAAIPVALIFCFENIMHFTITPTLMALSGDRKSGALRVVGGIVKSIVTNPFIIGTALGVAVAISGIATPEPVNRLVEYLAQAAAPSALFAMGVTIALRPLKRVPVELSFIVPMKLILHPLLMYLLLAWAGDFDRIWVFTAVLLAALPTATNVFVVAEQYGSWIQRASASILVTTGLSVVTVSALLYAITTGLLPADPFAG